MYIVPKQKWRYPMAIEREYAKDLIRYVEAEMKIVESFLPEMVEAVWRNRLQKDGFNDDGLGDWLGNLVKKVENKIAKVLSPVKAIEKTFAKVAKHVKEQFGGIFNSVFGAKPKAAKGEAVKLETMKNLWVNENLDLIKSVDRNVLDSVRRTLTEKVVAAADRKILMSDLTAEIERLTGVSRTRAALIGADQVGKLHGRLARQKQMSEGIERYIWATRGDSRVRPAHRVRHGVSYRWDSPPDGGHPGQAIRCRCVAQPIFDSESFDLTPEPKSFTREENTAIMTSGELSYEYLKENGHQLSNERARWWYDVHDKNIPNLVDKTKPFEEQARQAFELRNMYRTQTRELMGDRESAEKLEKKFPNWKWEDLIAHKMEKYHFSRNEAIKDIQNTATKTNNIVNKKYGVR